MSRLTSVTLTHALVPHDRYRQLLDIEQRLAAAESERDGLRLAGEELAEAISAYGYKQNAGRHERVVDTLAAWRRAAAAGGAR